MNGANAVDAETLRHLMPHAGAMVLIERVTDWGDDHLRAIAIGHTRLDHPLRRSNRLHPVILCEIGAQAMAIHGGLLAQRGGGRAQPGLLVALRDVWLAGGDVSARSAPLEVIATRMHGDVSAWQYRFELASGAQQLARGTATIALKRAADQPASA